MGPTWEPPGSYRPQMVPILAPWTLLSGYVYIYITFRLLLIWDMTSLWIFSKCKKSSANAWCQKDVSRGGYSSSSRAGRLGRTLWPQNSTSVAETEKGGQNSTMTPPTLEKGVNILHQYEKSAKKGGQKSTILENIGVKILQVWKWGSKFYMLKNRGQNSTMLEKRGSIFYIRPQK